MNFLDLFSGIGGFALGLERAGMRVKAFCEIDPFCQKVLRKHWPHAPIYSDIRELRKSRLIEDGVITEDESVDLICGGFPCQPFSVAGKQRGKEDNRYLWPEMLRVVAEIKPRWVIAENVCGILTVQGGMVFEEMCAGLEGEGYEVQAFVIPACAVNAPHRRDRVWVIAHSNLSGLQRFRESGACSGKSPAWATAWEKDWVEVATRLCGVDDGVSNRVDRLRALGNAVVPQIVEIIGRAIMWAETWVPAVNSLAYQHAS